MMVTTVVLTRRQRASAHVALVRAHARARQMYRTNYLFELAGVLIQAYLLKLIWSAVLPSTGSVSAAGGRQITLDTQISYATLAAIQYWLLNPWSWELFGRIRDGRIASDLARPVRFVGQLLCWQLGSTLAIAPLLVAALPFAVLAGGVRPPASAITAICYVCSLAMAGLISIILSTLVSMVAFWTVEISGMWTIYQMASQFLAGALVPLWFMPGWLASAAHLLPFHSTTYTPISIYLGEAGDGYAVFTALAGQCFWIATLWVALRMVAFRALRRIDVQGG